MQETQTSKNDCVTVDDKAKWLPLKSYAANFDPRFYPLEQNLVNLACRRKKLQVPRLYYEQLR